MTLQTAYEGQSYFTAVWSFINTGSSYINNTIEARRSGGTAFTILNNASDYLYIGHQSRFDFAGFILTINGGLGALTWQYWDGSAWVTFAAGENYDFTLSGAETFDNLVNWAAVAFSLTFPHVVASVPDTLLRYWIRVQAASVTTAPTVDQILARPLAIYATATDVAQTLNFATDFSASTRPTRATVENYIRYAQSYVDRETRKTWRYHLQRDEEYDFDIQGFKLVKPYPIAITRLQIWNGSTYDTKTQGRQNDYFLVSSTGMVYYARFFALPARFMSASGSIWGWGWGEFRFPVRVSYFYGSNPYTNEEEGGLVWDITRKLAAKDIWNSHDYSILTVSGSDKISMERKVDNWSKEIDEKLDRLRRFEIF